MQLIVARWHITIEQRANRSHKTRPGGDRLEHHVAHMRQLQALENRREWARDAVLMRGNPYEPPRP
jgi:hypothetical protein